MSRPRSRQQALPNPRLSTRGSSTQAIRMSTLIKSQTGHRSPPCQTPDTLGSNQMRIGRNTRPLTFWIAAQVGISATEARHACTWTSKLVIFLHLITTTPNRQDTNKIWTSIGQFIQRPKPLNSTWRTGQLSSAGAEDSWTKQTLPMVSRLWTSSSSTQLTKMHKRRSSKAISIQVSSRRSTCFDRRWAYTQVNSRCLNTSTQASRLKPWHSTGAAQMWWVNQRT